MTMFVNDTRIAQYEHAEFLRRVERKRRHDEVTGVLERRQYKMGQRSGVLAVIRKLFTTKMVASKPTRNRSRTQTVASLREG